jgi:hypothetical protein
MINVRMLYSSDVQPATRKIFLMQLSFIRIRAGIVRVLLCSHVYLNLISRLSVIIELVLVAWKYPVLGSLQHLTLVGVRNTELRPS